MLRAWMTVSPVRVRIVAQKMSGPERVTMDYVFERKKRKSKSCPALPNALVLANAGTSAEHMYQHCVNVGHI